ncbi:MAG: bacillithiol biosynthesis deacetylase BshB1 [Acidobacteriota bacterium]|nr:bacillithiol biosynthesis deacetylase BshB1 [Blastocatellia bacterium]MDW8412599.1 bacillithiol biosynthesis deacetylase BshB1 [Acidobacteriota bacterium]
MIDALFIGAHPDDVEISAGGTILKLVSMGYKVAVIDMSLGEMGTRGTREVRAAEARAAAAAMQLTIRETLSLPDARISCDDTSRTLMVRALRKLRPKVVFTHFWDDPHPDHAATARIVRESAHLAGLYKYALEDGQTRHRPLAIAHFLFPRTVVPSFLVDISDFAEKKLEVMLLHKSQFYDPNSSEPASAISQKQFIDHVIARQRYFGSLINVGHAEAFYVREALNVDDPVALLSRSMSYYS